MLDGCLGDCGVLEGCNIKLMIDEDFLPSLSDDEADLLDFSNDEINVCGWCTVDEFALPIATGLVTSSLRA